MENQKELANIPYFAHEGEMSRMERANKRLWILCIVLIALLLATNTAWIYYENQFEDTVAITQESNAEDGGNAIVNNEGSVIYGESKADDRQIP